MRISTTTIIDVFKDLKKKRDLKKKNRWGLSAEKQKPFKKNP